jgi:hypothetical protein
MIFKRIVRYLDVVTLLLAVVVEHISLGSLGDKEDSFEGDLAFSREVSVSHWLGGVLKG